MRIRNAAAVIAALVVASPVFAAANCASCHSEQARTQVHTSMAQALLAPGVNPVLAARPKLTLRNGAFTYTIERRDSKDTYSVTDGTGTLTVPVRWVFGAHSQTYVLEYQGRLYESLVSYYDRINGLAITMGDEKLQTKTLVEAMGRELSTGEARACFQCHATAAVVNDRVQTESLIAGVQCDRCHVGAEAHAQSISRGKLDAVPMKLSRLSSEDMSSFCGQCHRTFADVVRDRLFGQVNVRFQPYRLANSKCFDGSDSRISCVACHNPHHEVSAESAGADAKCLACHQPATASKAHKTCPVATSNCVSCHMPKVELEGGHQLFTDHFIRVVRKNEAYPN